MKDARHLIAHLLKTSLAAIRSAGTPEQAEEASRFEAAIDAAAGTNPALDFAEAAPLPGNLEVVVALHHIASLPSVDIEEATFHALATAYDQARGIALQALADLHQQGSTAATAALHQLAAEARMETAEAAR